MATKTGNKAHAQVFRAVVDLPVMCPFPAPPKPIDHYGCAKTAAGEFKDNLLKAENHPRCRL